MLKTSSKPWILDKINLKRALTSLLWYNVSDQTFINTTKETTPMNIIQYLLNIIQYLYQQNCWLLSFICRYVPLKQWSFDDSHSPKYQKFKVDELPRITDLRQDWTYKDLIPYFENVMARKSVQTAGVQTAIFQKAAPAHAVTLLCRFSTKITVQRSSSCARFVTPHFFQMKEGFQLQSYNALTVAGH